MTLRDVKEALLTIGVVVYHFFSQTDEEKYIVWAEDSEAGSLSGNNQKQEQSIQGTIDYFTKDEGDENVLKIQNALNEKEISFRLNSIQREDDTKFIHYEWVFEVMGLG